MYKFYFIILFVISFKANQKMSINNYLIIISKEIVKYFNYIDYYNKEFW